MNRTRKQCHAALGLLLWLQVSAGAHVGERLYPVSYLSDEMLAGVQLDGRIEEWYELLGEPAMTSLDFRINGEGEPPDPATLYFRIWLAWHDDPARFYVAFVAADDVYKNVYQDPNESSETSRFLMEWNDGIHLTIDGDHSGGGGCSWDCSSEDWAEAYGETQSYVAIARTPSGPNVEGPPTTRSWVVLPPYGEGGGSVAGEAPVISVIEFYVTPFDSWGSGWDSAGDNEVSELSGGKVIGFAIMYWDWDPPLIGHLEVEPLLPEGVEPGYFNSFRGDALLDGILLPVEPEDSAVEGSTWGRIKASLKVK